MCSAARPHCRRWWRAGKLMRMESPRLLFVHAHPDDETLTTGATIAHYVARGAKVQRRHVHARRGGRGDRRALGTTGARPSRSAGRFPNRRAERGAARAGNRATDISRRCRPVARLGDGRHAAATPAEIHRRRSARGRRRAGGHHPRAAPTRRRHLRRPTAATATPTTSTPTRSRRLPSPHRAAPGYPGEPWSVPKLYWTVMATPRDGRGSGRAG